jgi:mevalonate kinase
MKTPITVSVPGKIHLIGEHVVVYGKPAILASINKRVTATITPRADQHIVIQIPQLHIDKTVAHADIAFYQNYTKRMWNTYKQTNNSAILKPLTKEGIHFIMIAIGEALAHMQSPLPSGFTLTITSEFPMGSGLGSSAAVSAAVAGAVMVFLGKPLHKEDVNTIAFAVEQRVHGDPSGGDNTACTYGGLLWFEKKPAGNNMEVLSFTLSPHVAEKFCLIFTGKPDETTGEMVAKVKEQKEKLGNTFATILNHQEKLTKQLQNALQKKDTKHITEIIQAAEANLELLGVVSPSTQALIRSIEKAGGAAKICGGGGYAHASGVVLAFHEHPNRLRQIVETHKLVFLEVSLGEEGVREE